jgi:hypothetical protein
VRGGRTRQRHGGRGGAEKVLYGGGWYDWVLRTTARSASHSSKGVRSTVVVVQFVGAGTSTSYTPYTPYTHRVE